MAGRRIGGLWKPREGSKAKLNGTIDIMGLELRVSVFPNTDKDKHEDAPAYHIVSFGLKEEREKPSAGQNAGPSDDGAPPPDDSDRF